MKNIQIKNICYIAIFVAVIAVCAFISIPFAVPLTLQSFGVFVTLLILGGKRGSVAVAAYLMLGALSLPVFAGFGGGLGYLFGSTGGFLFGFLLLALFYWICTHFFGDGLAIVSLSLAFGMLLCYITGTVWFYFVYTAGGNTLSFARLLSLCVVPYILPDAVKLTLAILVGRRVARHLKGKLHDGK